MKRGKDEMRPEYKRSDFPKLERGKYYRELGGSMAVIRHETGSQSGLHVKRGSN